MNITKNHTLSTPFFVVGPLRSGTTLLRLLIGNHPEINCFGEFEGAVSQATGNEWPTLEQYYEFVKNDRQTLSYDFVLNEMLDYETLVKSFLEQLYDRNPCPFIGASVHSRMDLLPKLWSNAKFIHLLRDPRDVARSCIGMGWVGNVHEGAKYWIQPQVHWDILCETVPEENRHTVRYEDLVSYPEQELMKICHFIGVKYTEDMLNIEATTTYSKPDNKYAYQWRRKLSPRECFWVEYQCADLMKECGYQLSVDKLEKPGIFELAKIKLQNRSYRIAFFVKRYGVLIWLKYLLSKRLPSKIFKQSIQSQINTIDKKYLK